MSRLKILITGASGFIGSKLYEKCKEEGNIVYGWDCINDNNNEAKVVNLQNVEDICVSLYDIKPDIVIHCAGSADVSKSVMFPEKDYEGNVTLTHNLLFALHTLKMDKIRFVYLSSAGVYGNPLQLPITEETPTNPLSPYALHKVMCEKMCEYFAENYGMEIRIARIFSAYGEGLKKQIFWDMNKKLVETGKLEMFGTGNESRDYIHVDDLVNALYLIGTTTTSERYINVANGEEHTIRYVTEQFAERMGLEKDKILFNNVVREGDPLNWKADVTKLKSLGYSKSIEMSSGIERYCKWVKGTIK